MGGQTRRQPVGAAGGGVLPPWPRRGSGTRAARPRSAAGPGPGRARRPRARGLDHASPGELGAHRIGGAGDHLEAVGLRQESTFTNETTADESTPVTRHRSITRNRGGASSTRWRTFSSRRFVDPKKTKPETRRIWTRSVSPRSSARSSRSVDVGAVGLAERDLADELDPAVADSEQHHSEHEADHDPDQEPPDDDPGQDREHDGVLERRAHCRLSQTHSTRKASPRNTRTPPTIIRGISPITSAPTTTAARGRAPRSGPRPSRRRACAQRAP